MTIMSHPETTNNMQEHGVGYIIMHFLVFYERDNPNKKQPRKLVV